MNTVNIEVKKNRLAPNQNTRNTNIEWLRIVSMILIIAFHVNLRKDCINVEEPLIIYSTGAIFGSWGLLGVDLFLIISAWFLVSQQFRLKKVIHIVFQTFTWVLGYSVLYIIFTCFCYHRGIVATVIDFCRYSVDGFFQPLWSSYYWFVTTYFFMLLLFPFFNKMLEVLNQSQVKKILIVFSFVPIYAQFEAKAVCDVFCFMYVYLLIGYIKKYGCRIIEKYARPYFYVTLIAVVILSKFIIYYLSPGNKVLTFIRIMLVNTFAATEQRHPVIVMIIAILIFFDVLNKKPSFNNKVNRIASYCLGVYLFHENIVPGMPNTTDIILGKLTSAGFLSADATFPMQYGGGSSGNLYNWNFV